MASSGTIDLQKEAVYILSSFLKHIETKEEMEDFILSYEVEMLLIETVKKEKSWDSVYFALQGVQTILEKDGEAACERFELQGGLDALEKVQECNMLEI